MKVRLLKSIAKMEQRLKKLRKAVAAKGAGGKTRAAGARDATSEKDNNSYSIRRMRKAIGISQRQMALLTGVSTQAVYLWERKGGALRLRHKTRRTLRRLRTMTPAGVRREVARLEKPRV